MKLPFWLDLRFWIIFKGLSRSKYNILKFPLHHAIAFGNSSLARTTNTNSLDYRYLTIFLNIPKLNQLYAEVLLIGSFESLAKLFQLRISSGLTDPSTTSRSSLRVNQTVWTRKETSVWRSTRPEALLGCGTITTAPWPDTLPARCLNVIVDSYGIVENQHWVNSFFWKCPWKNKESECYLGWELPFHKLVWKSFSVPAVTTPPHEGGDCAPGWESYGANCYWFMPDDHVTWNTAQVLPWTISIHGKWNCCKFEKKPTFFLFGLK